MIVGVGLLMLTGYAGACVSLRDPDNPGIVRRGWRRSADHLGSFRRACSKLSRRQRLGVLWLGLISAVVLVRAVFELARAAHTEQGVIAGFLGLAAIACAGLALGVNSIRMRLRRPG